MEYTNCAGHRQQQQPHKFSLKADSNPAMKLLGSLAAAAVLLAPHNALANARLPPVDSGIELVSWRSGCDKGLHWLKQHL